MLDISERKRAEQTNLVLIAELEHRTRNLLAVVSALAEQTLVSCESIEGFVEPFRAAPRDAVARAGIVVARRSEPGDDR